MRKTAMCSGKAFSKRKKGFAWTLFLSFVVCLSCPLPSYALSENPTAPSINDLVNMKDSEIDLSAAYLGITNEVAWVVAKMQIDAKKIKEDIDGLAEKCRSLIAGERDPKVIVARLNEFLFDECDFKSDQNNDPLYSNYQNLLINAVLENRKGHCTSLTMIYLSIAQALGLPCFAVATPAHIFVRYDDGAQRINIETTDRGKSYPDEYYREKYLIEKGDAKYLRNLTRKQLLSRIVVSFGVTFIDRQRYEAAEDFLEKALKLDSENAIAAMNLGILYEKQGRLDDAAGELKRALVIDPHQYKILGNIGLVYQEKGDSSNSIDYFQRAIAVNPKYALGYYNLGVTYHLLAKNDEKAMENFSKALELEPNFLAARRNLMTLRQQRSRQRAS